MTEKIIEFSYISQILTDADNDDKPLEFDVIANESTIVSVSHNGDPVEFKYLPDCDQIGIHRRANECERMHVGISK